MAAEAMTRWKVCMIVKTKTAEFSTTVNLSPMAEDRDKVRAHAMGAAFKLWPHALSVRVTRMTPVKSSEKEILAGGKKGKKRKGKEKKR